MKLRRLLQRWASSPYWSPAPPSPKRLGERTPTADLTVTVHIENVPTLAITWALLAIETADTHGFFGAQRDQLTSLVVGLRDIRDRAVMERHP